MKSFKNTLIAASLFATTLLSPGVGAQSSTAGSLAISAGTALVVSGSLDVLVGSGQVVIESVKAVDESTYVVLKSIPGSIETTLRMSGTALGASALVAGKTVQLVTHTIGTLLVSAGEILAIVPNELGESLMQQSRH